MALRDQPYLPLYIQDFMTDERLNLCSAAANGVLIRLMCLMHKSEHYGKIELKQKFEQNASKIENFACMLAKQFPYTSLEIISGLNELIEEKVIHIEGAFLIQKRMVKDGTLSKSRAENGSEGGKKSATNKAKGQAKNKQNTEIEYEDDNEFKNNNDKKISENSTWDLEKQNFFDDGGWIIKFCSHKSLKHEEFITIAEQFISDIELKQDFKPFREIQSHFLNWYNKNKNINGAKTTQRTVTGNSRTNGADAFLEETKRLYQTTAGRKEDSAS